MISDDRELLAELARLKTAMTPLALRIMDGTATTAEQTNYARRLITAGEWPQRRIDRIGGAIIDGGVLTATQLAILTHTLKPPRES